MTSPPPDEDVDDYGEVDREPGADRGAPPGIPRWVIVLGLIAVVLVAGFVIIVITGGHDPGRMVH